MQLEVIVAALDAAGLLVTPLPEAREISGVVDDSRRVHDGALFCAIEGTQEDGHAFLEDARRSGAAAALVTRPQDSPLPQVVVRDSRASASVAAGEWYGRPAHDLTLVGVTGTNGKSTTVALIHHILNGPGTVGSIGTLGVLDGEENRLTGYGSLTTPGAVEFQAILAALKQRGVTSVVLEASSHGLDQERLYAVPFQVAVYTNLSREHLDYHVDHESYLAAKMKLSDLLVPGGVEVVNADDGVWSELVARERIRRLCYSRERDADVVATRVEFVPNGSLVDIRFGATEASVRLPLLGEFNVSNALAAAAAAWAVGETPGTITGRLASAPQIPGRMERLVSDPFTVVRDYAHTPDAFERVIATLRPVTAGRLVFLFGAGGDRDRGKRPEMGRIAAEGADLVVITSDNPRSEDPERILDDVERGMESGARVRIADREEAIRHAVSLLEPGDCLLLAGKGHETYQIVGTDKMPFHEPAIVHDALRQLARP